MNYKEKKRMYDHYTGLGWSSEDIQKWATKDLTGSKPAEEKVEKVEKKDKKSSK
tara:strand:+ start:1903 stop:2064 length:162 start_codon:yes stop_codon:yes gene_type:complete